MDFTESHEYSWHTPGHAGGTAFRKSQVGKAFYDFYGETLFRTDLSVSVAELGSLLDHSGVVGEAERNAARVFGADATYFVLNGTSTSNQIVAHACVVAGDVVLADRNCHKSVNYALTVTDAIPVYLMPSRNGYGIIGPIPPARLSPKAIADAVAASPLPTTPPRRRPCTPSSPTRPTTACAIDADRVVELLGKSVPRVHFDEAWFAYPRFHPLYAESIRHARQDASSGGPDHLRHPVDPQAPRRIFPSLDDPHPPERARTGRTVTVQRGVHDARLDLALLPDDRLFGRGHGDDGRARWAQPCRGGDPRGGPVPKADRRPSAGSSRRAPTGERPWFFGVWQPEEVHDPASNTVLAFVDTPDDLLETEPSCWSLEPHEAWHGFGELDSGYCMLDPTKVTLTTPGIDAAGHLAETGIPAPLSPRYLDNHRVEVEKTGDYSLLVLFSIGTTRGKWGTLLEGLLGFKRAYDSGQSLREAIPELVAAYPDRYGKMTLRELCDEMHAEVRARATIELLDRAFAELPAPATTPGEAYRRLVRGRTERVPVSKMAGRVAGGHGRALPSGHPNPHARRACRGARRPGAQLPARPGGLRRQVPGLRPRHPRGRARRTRHLLDRVPQRRGGVMLHDRFAAGGGRSARTRPSGACRRETNAPVPSGSAPQRAEVPTARMASSEDEFEALVTFACDDQAVFLVDITIDVTRVARQPCTCPGPGRGRNSSTRSRTGYVPFPGRSFASRPLIRTQ